MRPLTLDVGVLEGLDLHTSSGDEPLGRSWLEFLSHETTLRDRVDGVLYFGVTNCNYVVFPDGMIVANYGYHGRALMQRIREEGAPSVRAGLDQDVATLRILLWECGAYEGALHVQLKTHEQALAYAQAQAGKFRRDYVIFAKDGAWIVCREDQLAKLVEPPTDVIVVSNTKAPVATPESKSSSEPEHDESESGESDTEDVDTEESDETDAGTSGAAGNDAAGSASGNRSRRRRKRK